jgi:hypothetical protein
MWQRSEAFEVLGTYPAREQVQPYSFADIDRDAD